VQQPTLAREGACTFCTFFGFFWGKNDFYKIPKKKYAKGAKGASPFSRKGRLLHLLIQKVQALPETQ